MCELQKLVFDDPAWLHDTYLYNMTCESIGIRTTGSEFIEKEVCLLMLICIEEGDGLKYVMK